MKVAIAGKGGAGKTTIAGTLARVIAEQGQQVVAIDDDSNPNLALTVGVDRNAAATLHGIPRDMLEERTDADGTTRLVLAVPAEDFIEFSRRGTVRELPVLSGTPKDVADGLEEWFVGEGCDGFVLAATHMPGAYEDFTRLVVPELQRRGLFQREYAGTTLRENLGLPRPARGAWRTP